jgi:flavorubredoxin
MQNIISIGDRIYLIGINDRRTHLFENIWPLPHGVSYNSYLIVDDKTALLDTVEAGSGEGYIERIEALLEGRTLDYLVVNHLEPDHSSQIGTIMMRWPEVSIIGNGQTRKILAGYYTVPQENFIEVADGDTLSLGKHTLQFHFTPWVHWPETMMTYETSEQILFSADAFGTFAATDGNPIDTAPLEGMYESEMRRYYSNIVGKYNGPVQKALAKLSGLTVRTLCPLHGPVWREHAAEVIALYDKWSKCEANNAAVIIYASMYGNTARMADHIAEAAASRGVRDIKVYDVSKTHLSYLISEIWRCKYVVLGSCSYNAGMFPLMEMLCNTMKSMCLKNRSLAIFGSGSWAGGGMRALNQFAGESGWDKLCESVEIIGRAVPEKMASLDSIAEALASVIDN